MKKLLLNILIIIVLFSVYNIYKRYSSGYDVLQKATLQERGQTQQFEFETKKGRYTIGLSMRDSQFSDMYFDGNYTIEYYLNGKLDRKEIINNKTFLEYYGGKGLYTISSNWSGGMLFTPVTWKTITLGAVVESGKHIVKITVHQPESQIKTIQKQLYFFANKIDEKMATSLSSFSKENQKRRLLKNTMDVKETNQTLISLRDALDNGDLKSIETIIKNDNNITVNTDMVLGRRAIHYAAFYNHIKTTNYLIKNGADLHHKDALGKNALAYAIENNATKTAKLLIKSGVDVNEVKFVQNYLQYKIKEKRHDGRVMSALQYTAGNALFEMTELLLKNGMQDNIIVSEAANVNVYTYMYWYTTMTKEEQQKMQKLFDKYGVKVENLNKPKTVK